MSSNNPGMSLELVRSSLARRHQKTLRRILWVAPSTMVFCALLLGMTTNAQDHAVTFLLGWCVLSIAASVGTTLGVQDVSQGVEEWTDTLPMPRALRYRALWDLTLRNAMPLAVLALVVLISQAPWWLPGIEQMRSQPTDLFGMLPSPQAQGLWWMMPPMALCAATLGLATGASGGSKNGWMSAIGATLVLMAVTSGVEVWVFGHFNGVVGVPALLAFSYMGYHQGLRAFEGRDVALLPSEDSSKRTAAVVALMGVLFLMMVLGLVMFLKTA